MAYAGIVLYNKKGQILLQLRDNNLKTRNPNKWGLFGGGIEKGETPEQAIKRECMEELGLNLVNPELILTMDLDEQVNIFKKELEDFSKLKLMEGKDMKLFTKNEILKLRNVLEPVRRIIISYF